MTSLFKLVATFSVIALIAPLPALIAPLPAKAEWVPAASINNNGSIYIESDSVARTGNIVSYWQRHIRTVPDEQGAIAYDLYVSRNCYSGNWGTTKVVGYSSNATVLFDITKASPVFTTKPGTSGGDIHELVCYASNTASTEEFINNSLRQRY